MNLTVYVGPYLSIPKSSGFEWEEFDFIVTDGRGEAGVKEPDMILIPNSKIAGIDREMVVDRLGSQEMAEITPPVIVRETSAFLMMCHPLLNHFRKNSIEARHVWGVVPCWS